MSEYRGFTTKFLKGSILDTQWADLHNETQELFPTCPNILTNLELCKEKEKRLLQLQMIFDLLSFLILKKKMRIVLQREKFMFGHELKRKGLKRSDNQLV